MKRLLLSLSVIISFTSFNKPQEQVSWIRINLLGYTPGGIKVAVWCGKERAVLRDWQLVDAASGKIVYSAKPGKAYGAYGPFCQTYRFNFSSFNQPGRYYLQTFETRSPEFRIADDVYKGAADFCLRYMRQQRSGFNPFLKDSCHTHDGYVLYGKKAGIEDSTHIDVVGGWHDASDYLQYAATSATATYQLLAAYCNFPGVFGDEKLATGLDGKNGMADVLDEAKWGLDWLLKMHPKENWMFNQVGDDRDHQGMRIPGEDSFYGKGYERPVYFLTGEPQQKGKTMNNTTGRSSSAAKFASAFATAAALCQTDHSFRAISEPALFYQKALSAYNFAKGKIGYSQTASVRSPYIYAEENWADDLELAAATIHRMIDAVPSSSDNGYYLVQAVDYAKKEPVTPWLGSDTARHYQWYPFVNCGHFELLSQLEAKKSLPTHGSGYYKEFVEEFPKNSDTIRHFIQQGIQLVWNKASGNAFYRGIPFIWCSNNLTTSFAIQCCWYRQLTKDNEFAEFEEANFDWLFGCNPWGTSFVYGLPARGDSPTDPHSAFTHLKNYPIDGGLVDGPVSGSIYKNLLGIQLHKPDEYDGFQSDLAVYHDDYGDYSTNEPTMEGTASLIYLLAAKEWEAKKTGNR
jgi:endoglucanase